MALLKYIILFLVPTKVLSNPFELKCVKSAFGTSKSASYFRSFCYSMNPIKIDFSHAFESCTDLANGRLAFVTDQKQIQFVDYEFDIKNGVWSGVMKSSCQSNDTCDSSQEWVYVNGQLKSIMHPNMWAAGEPNTTAGDAAILTKQGYKVANSTQKHPVLCQYPEPQDSTRFFQRGRDVKAQSSAVSKTLSVSSQSKCGVFCAREDSTRCSSYGFNPQTGICLHYWLSYELLSLTQANDFILMDRQKSKIDAYSCPAMSHFNGEVTYSKTEYYGRVPDETKAKMTCAAKERMIDGINAKRESNHTCIAPYWMPPRPANCQPVCDTKEVNTTAASISPSFVYSDGTAPNGTDLTVSCHAGHYITDTFDLTSDSAVCNAQNWFPNVPTCRKGENFYFPRHENDSFRPWYNLVRAPFSFAVQEWSLVTKTGTVGAGGSSNGVIYIMIFGTEGTSRQIFPSNGGTNYLYDAQDTFTLKTEVLGNVNEIEIGTTSGDGWWVEWIQLYDIANAQTYTFTCNFWIDGDEVGAGIYENIRLTPN